MPRKRMLRAAAPLAAATTKPVWPLQRDATAFYGNPLSAHFARDNIIAVSCPWPLFMGRSQVSHIMIHRKCGDSLTRVLESVWESLGHDVAKIKALHYDQFDGSFVIRNKRGGSSLSMHAYGAAIDFDAADNAFHATHHLFTHDSPIVKAFEAEGWVWGGSWSLNSIDAMHVQASRIHP